MKISDLQRQIKFNSNIIKRYEVKCAAYKIQLLDACASSDFSYYCAHNTKKLKSKIKRLAALQKVLKKEIAYKIDFEKAMWKILDSENT